MMPVQQVGGTFGRVHSRVLESAVTRKYALSGVSYLKYSILSREPV